MIETPRLLLRLWRESDREPFAELNADPVVMRHFPATLTRAGSDDLVDRIERHYERHGFTVYAAERKDSGEFIGFIGLAVPEWEAYFTPCVEIGWRLARKHWNQGLATEGARAALEYGFGVLGLREVVSFTTTGNMASRRVMEKIGMVYEGEFDHPRLAEGHALRRHVLYRATNSHE